MTMEPRTIRLNCPYCSVMVEIDPPEGGGPVAGDNLVCAACENVFTLNERRPTEAPPEVYPAEKPPGRGRTMGTYGIFTQVGAVMRSVVVALALLTLMAMMFVFGSIYGDTVLRALAMMFN